MNSNEIKVLQLIETLGPGGAERLLVCALKNIDMDRFSPTVVCLYDEMDLKEEIEDAGIPVYCIGLKSLYHWWQAIFKIYRLIKKEKFDIVHTHLFFANVYGRIASRVAGVRSVLTTLHNPDYTYEDSGRFSYKIRKLIDKYSGAICNKYFLAVSNFVKKDFKRHMGFKNVEVLYNCIDVNKFDKFDKSQIQNKRRELGLSDDEIILLNIGRLHPQKGQLYLIEALNIIREKNQKCKLLIIGKGDLETELQMKVKKMELENHVIFLKGRKDIPEIMHSCDIYVSSSVYEGFGIALVEAMASGMPVIASEVGTTKEIIKDNVEGIIIEKENSERLAEAISTLIQDKAKMRYLGENAKKKAWSMFDVNIHIKKLERVYQELVCNSASLR